MPLFDQTTLEARRARAARAFGDDAPLVLIGAGHPVPIPGGHDQTFPFVPHPEYYWLTGLKRPGGILAYDPREGWTHFVQPVTEAERLWEGEPEVPEETDLATFAAWLHARRDRPVAGLGVPPEGVAADARLAAAMRERLDRARRAKDGAELEILSRAVAATAAGHARAREVIRPGVTERQIQVELEAEMLRHGAEGTGYGTIVGAGSNAAVLHFAPSSRRVTAEELVLVDAGAQLHGYTADVTRTYPAGDAFSAEHQAVYDIVLAAERKGVSMCRPGTEWHDVHLAVAAVLAEGLRSLGILKGETDALLESGAIALFFPHGVGHMVGLGVRDVGGRAPGRSGEQVYAGARIRVDLPLEEHFLMTVEPGLYFVPALLDDPARRARFQDRVAWETLERWRPVGGVRIEDNVLVTAGAPQNLTEEIPV